jgi:5-methylcytosine-specific restriction endonuclease McrA
MMHVARWCGLPNWPIVGNVCPWVARLRRWCPIGSISVEVVRFDTQKLQHPEISGIQYQHGELLGYEIRGYLLEKWGRRCVYCDACSVPLQIEHVVPRSQHGSSRASNLVLACEKCNRAKGNQDVRAFLADQPERLQRLLEHLKTPLVSAAVMNSLRWRIYDDLKATGLPVETGTGGRTQYNRVRLGLPKAHWIDAAATGASTPEQVQVQGVRPWLITAMGQQSRRMRNVDKRGFPVGTPKCPSRVRGFRTGDLVKVTCPPHLKTAGTHVGRVLVRSRGSFDIQTGHGRIPDVSARYFRRLQAKDGYRYMQAAALPPPV